MQTANPKLQIAGRCLSPAGTLSGALVAAAMLALLPSRWTDPLRAGAATVLRPAQEASLVARDYAAQTTAQVKSHFQTAQRLTHAEAELLRLRQENQRLAADLVAAQDQLSAAQSAADAEDRLLLTHTVAARVLGCQARAFLARRRLLDVGAREGVDPNALVLDTPPVIDRGGDADLKGDQLVLRGRRVWGKIVHAGPYTSTVQAATEPGYRDTVQVGRSPDAQGTLHGKGNELARICRVPVTAPVAVGDLVYTTSTKGLLPAPLIYGQVTRAERTADAAYWEIWMQPAVVEEPDRVTVLRVELSPIRMADKEQRGGGKL